MERSRANRSRSDSVRKGSSPFQLSSHFVDLIYFQSSFLSVFSELNSSCFVSMDGIQWTGMSCWYFSLWSVFWILFTVRRQRDLFSQDTLSKNDKFFYQPKINYRYISVLLMSIIIDCPLHSPYFPVTSRGVVVKLSRSIAEFDGPPS